MQKRTPIAVLLVLLLSAGLVAFYMYVIRDQPDTVAPATVSEEQSTSQDEAELVETKAPTSTYKPRGFQTATRTRPDRAVGEEADKPKGPVHSSDIPTDNGAHYFLLAYEMSQDPNYDRPLGKFFELETRMWDDPEVRELLRLMEPILKAIQEGLDIGNAYMPPALVDSDEMMAYMAWWREVGRGVKARARLYTDHGDPLSAIDDLTMLLKYSSEVPRGGALIQGLVGYAVSGLGTQGIDELLEFGQLDASHYPALIAQLIDADLNSLTGFDVLDSESAFAERSINSDSSPFAIEANRPMAEQYLTSFDQLRDWFALPYPELQQQDIDSLTNGNPLMASVIPALLRAADASVRNQATLRATSTMVALDWYHSENGAYPASLDTLSPAYLPTLPIDPFTGSALIYREDDGDYVLYSTGRDMTDNEGAEGRFSDEGADLIFR